MNEAITKYIAAAPKPQQQIMETLRGIIHQEVPGVVEHFKWGRPVFSTDKDFAYFKTTKSYLTLGFFKFDKITHHRELLEGTGKDMRHIKIGKPDALQPEMIRSWIIEVTT